VLDVAGDDHARSLPTPGVGLHALDEIWRQSRRPLSSSVSHRRYRGGGPRLGRPHRPTSEAPSWTP
jgi:hypothetical protein